MRDGWAEARRLFVEWPRIIDDVELSGTSRRLADALADLADGKTHSASWRDVAALTRQVLLEARARGNREGVEVPLDPRLPTREQWEKAGCETLPTQRGLRVSARPWHPPVHSAEALSCAEEDLKQIYLGQDSPHRRKLELRPADPFWSEALGFEDYVSVGQQQAARAVVLAPAGSTTIVCLPTGHGKTEVVQASALLASTSGGVSVVVVPTVVLALDMERRTKGLLGRRGNPSPTGRYAYTGGMSADLKQQICDDVRTGRQRLLFTSPEALVTTLKRPLEDAAEAGLLQYFVIDEAHLVEQWGNSFRPHFQTMASHRRTWLSKAPAGRAPVTVAMSATLTQQQIGTLERLFAEEAGAEIVWASQLRHEPTYYLDSYPDARARQDAVLEAVAMLPRPLALYATKVEDVVAWASRLRQAGFQRTTYVTGDSNDEERRAAVEGWGGSTPDGRVATRFDVVVGTSAFGLGVDLSDVRTVVHACLPETIDRYYQEVGRGGRDGNPCIAYMATAPGDEQLAEHVSRDILIGPERAWERWNAMFLKRERGDGGVDRVSLDALPSDMPEGYNQHRTWNLQTLNLMVRADLIRVTIPEPLTVSEEEPLEEWEKRRQSHYSSLDVTLLDSQTNNRSHFIGRFGKLRQTILVNQQTALSRLQAALRSERCWGDSLADHYQVFSRGGRLRTGVTCRGCPHCRAGGPPQVDLDGFYRLAVEPLPQVPSWRGRVGDPLAGFRSGLPCLSITWENEREFRDLVPDLLEGLVARGMPVIGGPGLQDAQAIARLQRAVRPSPVVLDIDEGLLDGFRDPIVWLLPVHASEMEVGVAERFDSEDVTYLLHPRFLSHPNRPDTPLIDIHRAHISVRTALESL